MTRGWTALFSLVLTGCFLGGHVESFETVDDERVLGFAERIQGFYAGLEAAPLDALVTFDSSELRGYFRTDQNFSDYYASLAAQVRSGSFRGSTASRILVDDFSFPSRDLAHVEVTFVGRHMRVLRFWEIQVHRMDAWQYLDGNWYLTPEKF